MTVSSSTRTSGPYSGNGVTTVFDYEFVIFDSAHLTVIKMTSGVSVTLTEDVDYTVDGVGAADGGAVTLTVAPATGQTITIYGNTPFTQETDLENQGAYFAEVVERAFDLSVLRDLELRRDVNAANSNISTLTGRHNALEAIVDGIDYAAANLLGFARVEEVRAGTDGQTEVVVPGGYVPGLIEVLRNGVDMQIGVTALADDDSADVIASNGYSVFFPADVLVEDDRITFKMRRPYQVLDPSSLPVALKADLLTALAGTDDAMFMTPFGTLSAMIKHGLRSAFMSGGVGNGTATDLTPWRATEALTNAVYVPQGAIFNLGTDYPLKPVYGAGKIKRSGVELGGFNLVFDAYRCNTFYTPDDPVSLIGFPGTAGQYSTVFSPGSQAQSAAYLVRSTFFGPRILETAGASVDRVDGFGDSVFRRMLFGERSGAFCALSCEQLGGPGGADHNFWFDGGGTGIAIAPGSPGWDYAGLETANPGIGAKILAAWVPATVRTDVTGIYALGRDSFNLALKGSDGVALGYRAFAYNWIIYRNVGVGTDVFRNGVLLQQATGQGHRSGMQWQEGLKVSLFGTYNAFNTIRGSNVLIAGNDNFGNIPDVNSCIAFGFNLLTSLSLTSLTDKVAIGRDNTPIIFGDLATGRTAFNKPVTALDLVPRGIVHAYSGASGSAVGVALGATELVLESNGNCGVTMLGTAATERNIFFARPGAEQANYIKFVSDATAANQYLAIAVGDAERVRIDGSGNLLVGRLAGAAGDEDNGIVLSPSGFAYFARTGTGAQAHIQLINNAAATATIAGSIYSSGSGATLTMSLRDSANGERVSVNATGVGFNATAPIAKPTLPGAGVVSADDIRTVLINYGLAA